MFFFFFADTVAAADSEAPESSESSSSQSDIIIIPPKRKMRKVWTKSLSEWEKPYEWKFDFFIWNGRDVNTYLCQSDVSKGLWTKHNFNVLQGNKLRVEILSLTFEPSSDVASDKSVQCVYVEYRLLGVPMETTETPMSLRKPIEGEEIHYNFTRGKIEWDLKVFRFKASLRTLNLSCLSPQWFMWMVPTQLRSDSIFTPCWRAVTPTRAGTVHQCHYTC